MPRIVTAGGAVVRDLRVLTAGVLEGVHVTLRKRCDVLDLPLRHAMYRMNPVPIILVPMLITYPRYIGVYL